MDSSNKEQLSGVITRKTFGKHSTRGKCVEITGMSGVVCLYFKIMSEWS